MNSAIIVAAGRGKRMGGGPDKLFLEVAGLPVVGHTWQRFDSAAVIDEVVMVVREERRGEFDSLARRLNLTKPFRLVNGGNERQDSVWNGVQDLPPETRLVAIQDAARPAISPAIIEAVLTAASEHGAAVAASPMTDTVKESKDGRIITSHLDRSRLWAVQTPQCFRVEVIRRALNEVRERHLSITDDTAACALIGQTVRLVPSSEPNPKITTPEDVPYVDWLLRRR